MELQKTGTEVMYWHPAFCAEIQMELENDADNLDFEAEHLLSQKPMSIDVLIIKKEKDIPVKKNIGRIFKKHNIVEYKSPGDYLSVDDFYKAYGYTCFYKADVPYVDSISIEEITITFVTEAFPHKMIKHLQNIRKYTVENVEPGIYYVSGDLIPIQIIVTRELSAKENLWLKSLTDKLDDPETAKKLVESYQQHTNNNLYRAVMEAIMRKNQEVFDEVNNVCDALWEIVQPRYDRQMAKELEEATNKLTAEVTNKVTAEVTNKVTAEVTNRTTLINLISLTRKKCIKGKPLSVIAEELEEEPIHIQPIYEVVLQNQEKSVEEIYELIS